MMKSFFKAQCPLELGDTVAIFPGEAATLYYLPDGVKLSKNTAEKAELHTVTEIMAQHFVKAQKVVFAYQLDNTEDFVAYTVKVPVQQLAKAVDTGGGVILP